MFLFVFLIQYNHKIEQIVINELLYQDLGDEINKLKGEKQEIISEEELLNELLQKQKENFVRYNLISKERLFSDCGKQFNKGLSETIVNKGNGIRV